MPSTAPRQGIPAALDELRRLTPRDMYVLDVLAEHHVLTAEQIARLKFTDENTARKRLVVLQRRKILDRFRDGVRPGSQAWRYTLGPLGAAIVAAGRGKPVPRPATHADRVLRLARSPKLHHLLGVNEFFVALAARGRADSRYGLAWWLSERRATEQCAGLAHPDGLGTWTYETAAGYRAFTFFLEHDTGTESLPRVLGKLSGYAEARLGDGPDHPVLIRIHSTERERHLRRLLDRGPAAVPVVTSVHGAPRWDPTAAADPCGPAWLVHGDVVRHELIHLVDVLGTGTSVGEAA